MDLLCIDEPRALPATLLAIALAMSASTALAQAAATPAPGGTDERVPSFDAAYMNNPANIEIGQAVWSQQCRHCHGNAAYPGKAPKLSPGGMEPDFIFDRVTYGFRKMPPWKAVFTLEQRKGVVAYIKSDKFSP